MHDLKAIRANPEEFDAALQRRGLPEMSPQILQFDKLRRAIVTSLEDDQLKLNDLSREISQLKRAGEDTASREIAARLVRQGLSEKKEKLPEADQQLTRVLSEIPNLLDEGVPEDFRLHT
jgi:seryl-tRNA synthetase